MVEWCLSCVLLVLNYVQIFNPTKVVGIIPHLRTQGIFYFSIGSFDWSLAFRMTGLTMNNFGWRPSFIDKREQGTIAKFTAVVGLEDVGWAKFTEDGVQNLSYFICRLVFQWSKHNILSKMVLVDQKPLEWNTALWPVMFLGHVPEIN